MSYVKKEFKTLSSDGIHTLAGVVYVPEGEKKGFFHIVHGMAEYIVRYEPIMSSLAEAGYICFGYDHLGHGRTAKDKSELGFIAPKKGYDLLCRDVKVFSDAVREEYDKNLDLPYYLMGHSMGSFVVRLATERYVQPDKLIIMGTGGANPASGVGIALTSLIGLFRGKRHVSKLIYKLAFGGYVSRFKNDPDVCSRSWLSTDPVKRDMYKGDEYCGFPFSVSAMGDLMTLLQKCNRSAWYKNMPPIPMLLVAGEDDPVGNYSKGVLEVEKKLKKRGHNVRAIIYKGARHEILNDFTYDEVKKDILEFVK